MKDVAEANPDAPIDQSCLVVRTGYQITRAELNIHRKLVECLDAFGLRPVEYSILLLIDANTGINQRQIGEVLGVSPPNLVAVINRLIKRRLVQRSQGLRDRRVQHLHLTPQGVKLLEAADADAMRFEEKLVSSLTAQETRILKRALAKIVDF